MTPHAPRFAWLMVAMLFALAACGTSESGLPGGSVDSADADPGSDAHGTAAPDAVPNDPPDASVDDADQADAPDVDTGGAFDAAPPGGDASADADVDAAPDNDAGPSAEVDAGSPPPAPADVTASAGTHTDGVSVSWLPVEDVDGYVVYRDGARLTPAPISAPPLFDADATPAGPPGPPLAVFASSDRHDGVELTWEPPAPTTGPPHTYRVAAVRGGFESALSDPAQGHRAGPPILAFHVTPEGGGAIALGYDATGLLDVTAPPPQIVHGVVTAAAGVTITVADVDVVAGAARSYAVAAESADGMGEAAFASGRRVPGALHAQLHKPNINQPETAAPVGTSVVVATPAAALTLVHITTLLDLPDPGWPYQVALTAEGADPVTTPAVVFQTPSFCGDGMLSGPEECDGPLFTYVCSGSCGPDCRCAW